MNIWFYPLNRSYHFEYTVKMGRILLVGFAGFAAVHMDFPTAPTKDALSRAGTELWYSSYQRDYLVRYETHPVIFGGLLFWYSSSSTVQTAPLTFSTRTKHLCRLRLWRTAFCKQDRRRKRMPSKGLISHIDQFLLHKTLQAHCCVNYPDSVNQLTITCH